jgi:phasin family protein
MADPTSKSTDKAQEATRSMFDTMQGMAGMQSSILQRLSEIQQSMLKQASEAANEQLQLLTKARDPRAFASAQADLVKRHGQLYVDQLKKSVDIIAGAWEEYGDQVEKSAGAVTDKAQSATSTRKSS